MAVLNAMAWDVSLGNFEVIDLPSMRMIIDLSDLSKSVSINSTGQSGHPGSQWYGNMIDSFINLKYNSMLWTRQQVLDSGVHKLYLNP
jgi:penicillin amidase